MILVNEEDVPEELDLFKVIVRLEGSLYPLVRAIEGNVRDMWKIYIEK